MKTDPSINRKVDLAMESLDGIQQASPTAYLLTRIHARLEDQAEARSFWGRVSLFVSRPVVAVAFFAAVLAVNISFFLATENSSSFNVASSGNYSDIQSDDLLMAGNNTYDYANPE